MTAFRVSRWDVTAEKSAALDGVWNGTTTKAPTTVTRDGVDIYTDTSNLIPPAIARIEVDAIASPLVANGTGLTLAVDKTWASAGTRSVRITGGTGTSAGLSVTGLYVTAGQTYTASAVVRRGQGTTPVMVELKWRDSGNAAMTSLLGPAANPAVGEVATITATGVCPTGAARAILTVRYNGTPGSTDYFNVDEMRVALT